MKEQTVTQNQSYRLITIPISHYCEKARWALDWLQFPYIEEPHVPLFHRWATLRHAGKSVPVLVTSEGALVDSTDILRYLNAKRNSDRQLYPDDRMLRRQIDELEELFDRKLGVSTRCWVYFYRLKDKESMRRAWCQGTPEKEQLGFDLGFPIISLIVKKNLQITPDAAKAALQEIKQIFATVSAQLEDGRRYLVGNEFSAADLTFAALSAPVLLPPEHPIKVSKIEDLDREMRTTVEQLRTTPAGEFALRLYRENR